MPPKRRVDPVCGTCRKKCRKCDRAKPECKRCLSQGLVCEGYPLNIKMYGMEGGALRKSRPRGRESASVAAKVKPASKPVPEAAPKPAPRPTTRAVSARVASPFERSPSSGSSPINGMAASTDGSICVDTTNLRLEDDDVQSLLAYYENIICPQLSITAVDAENPFKACILPLARAQPGVMKAVLGLTSCHLATQGPVPNRRQETAALEYRLSALQSLSALLLQEEVFKLNEAEEETALAIVLMLVLHDTFESGKSLHGAHLNGVAFLCSRLVERGDVLSWTQMFLITALTWFDLLRGASGAEKLAFPQNVRAFISTSENSVLTSLVGCPTQVFIAISETLTMSKEYFHHRVEEETFELAVEDTLQKLESWDPFTALYPNEDSEWIHLADAYRHMAKVRVLRCPDPFRIPCSDHRVRTAVESILDASTRISRRSPYFKRLLFPLFVAGADTTSPHQQQYVAMCVEHITEMTGVTYHSVLELLEKTWQDRLISDGLRNVPWNEYTCSIHLPRQHDYLFF